MEGGQENKLAASKKKAVQEGKAKYGMSHYCHNNVNTAKFPVLKTNIYSKHEIFHYKYLNITSSILTL